MRKETRFAPAFDAPFFNEFTLQCPVSALQAVERLADEGILAGIRLDHFYADREDQLLIAVTEKRTKVELDRLVKVMAEIG